MITIEIQGVHLTIDKLLDRDNHILSELRDNSTVSFGEIFSWELKVKGVEVD